MASITNNYAAGSCIFEAGSTQNGDVYIQGGTFYQGVAKAQPETPEAAPCEEEASTPSPRGPRKQFLFIDGKPTVENVAVRQREKERFCRYLSDHKLGSRLLTCLKQDTLNKVVICFLKEWREREWIAEKPSGVAVFRFLPEVCELQSEVTPTSYSNKVTQWLKQPVDAIIKLDVRECFKE